MQIISVENEVIWMCPEITDKEDRVGRWINMTHEQFKEAADYWNKKERTEMPKEALKQAIDAYVKLPIIPARLQQEPVIMSAVHQSNTVFMTENFGCFQKAEKNLLVWRRMRMCVLQFMINMMALVI